MTLKLYFAPGACSFVPHVLLEASGAAFEPVMVKLHKGEQQSPEYRAINPRAQVPVLVDGAEVITQILAIIGYLNDRFPRLGFLPAEPLARARAMETLAWMNNTVHPAFTHIFMPQKFSDNPAVHEDLRRYNAGLYRGMMGELQALVQRAKAAGQDWLGGANFGPMDAYALTLTALGQRSRAWIRLAFPALWAHRAEVWRQLPAAAAGDGARAPAIESLSRPGCLRRPQARMNEPQSGRLGVEAQADPQAPGVAAPGRASSMRDRWRRAAAQFPARWAGPGLSRPRWYPAPGRKAGTPARALTPGCPGQLSSTCTSSTWPNGSVSRLAL
jgi:glutathione S-transferase